MNFDRRLIAQIRFAKLYLAAVILIGFGGGVLTILQAEQLSRLVSGVFLSGNTLEDVRPGLWIIFGIVISRFFLTFLGEIFASAGAAQIKAQLRQLWIEKVFRLGPIFVRGRESGALAAQAVDGIESIDAYFSQFLPQVVLAALIPLLILIMVFPLDWLTGVVLLLTAPLIPIFMILIGRTAEAMTHRQWTILNRMSAFFLDTIQGLVTLKELGQNHRQVERISQVSHDYRLATINVLRVTFLSALVLELVGTISTAVISVEIGLRLLYARMEFEQAFFILLIAPDFYLPLRMLGQRFHAGMNGVTAAKSLFAIIDMPEPGPTNRAGKKRINLGEPFTVDFQGVSFQYSDAAEPVLDRIDLTFPYGKKTVLIGPSGSGKTTLTALLLQFIQPSRGVIRVNGEDLSTLPIHQWREQIGWISQRPYLFPGTVEENILLGRPLSSRSDLERAVELSGLIPYIQSQPGGLTARVGERGQLISGGQAQRIALARVVLRNAPFLIVDEPTAQVDPELERFLVDTLQKVYSGRTVVMIAHRLASIRGAERIVVIEQGKVTQQGLPADLALQPGYFASLLQARGGQV